MTETELLFSEDEWNAAIPEVARQMQDYVTQFMNLMISTPHQAEMTRAPFFAAEIFRSPF